MQAQQVEPILNIYVDEKSLVIVRRGEDGERYEERRLAQYLSYHREEDVPASLMSDLRSSSMVLKVTRERDGWIAIDWQPPFKNPGSNYAKDVRRTMMFDAESPFRAPAQIATYEGDVDPALRYLVDTGASIQKPRRCYYDLETDSRVPFSRKEDMRVLCWSVVDESDLKVVKEMRAAGASSDEVTRAITFRLFDDGRTGILNQDSDADEKRLLEELWAAIGRYDQAGAWNGDGFDEVVIHARSEKLDVDLDFDPREIIFIDHMMVFDRMNVTSSESGDEKMSKRLQDVSTSLGLEGKDDFDASQTWQEWAAGGDRRERMMLYNVKDSILLPEIEEKTGYLDLFFSICEACGVIPNSLSTNPIIHVDSFLLRLGRSQGMHFVTRQRLDEKKDEQRREKQFAGAHVIEPKFGGIARDVHVCDFARLYPSIILSFNMSPETVVGYYEPMTNTVRKIDGERVPFDASRWARAPRTNVVFDQTKKGILVAACEEMIRLRVYWNDLKAKCSPGTPEWVEADRRSTAYKIAVNAFYGVISSVMSRYFDVRVGESITQTGVELLFIVAAEFERLGFFVGAGDTDSVFANKCTDDEFTAAVKHLNVEVFPKFIKSLGCQRNDVKLAYEKKFDIIFFTAKKHYAGKYNHYKGSPAKRDSKPEIKGFEFKRGDYSRLCRALQLRVIRMILGDWEEPFTPRTEDASEYEAVVAEAQRSMLCDPLQRTDFVVAKSINLRLPPSPKEIEEYLSKMRAKIAEKGEEPMSPEQEKSVSVAFTVRRCSNENYYKARKKQDGTLVAFPPQVQIALILKDRGEEVQGTKVGYVVTDGSTSPMKIIPASDADDSKIDRFYLWENMVWPATERVLNGAFPGLDWEKWGKVRPKKVRAKKVSGRTYPSDAQSVLDEPIKPEKNSPAASAVATASVPATPRRRGVKKGPSAAPTPMLDAEGKPIGEVRESFSRGNVEVDRGPEARKTVSGDQIGRQVTIDEVIGTNVVEDVVRSECVHDEVMQVTIASLRDLNGLRELFHSIATEHPGDVKAVFVLDRRVGPPMKFSIDLPGLSTRGVAVFRQKMGGPS